MIRVRKHVVLLMGIFLLAIGGVGCSNSTSGGSGSGKQIVSVATVQPDSHPISIGLRAMKDYIEQNLGDKYEVKIYYNSIMGAAIWNRLIIGTRFLACHIFLMTKLVFVNV